MLPRTLHTAILTLLAAAIARGAPQDDCWPSTADWIELNTTLSGKLIATQPLAISCYPGVDYDELACANVLVGWYNSSIESESPVGLDYPTNITCLPVNITDGEEAGSCSLGSNPRYAVNVTVVEDISAALDFAKKRNLRVVVKTTGHDILGRSDGYGSLEIWLRHFRRGIEYQSTFKSASGCTTSGWQGPALKLGGGYMWREVYPVASANNVVVVGGGSPTVSSTGGWMQGGGHGPASHQFGLGADQVLEAQVVLANGSVITADACTNSDLYFAIRGGGPSTYGVIASTTIKAWPQVNATVHNFQLAPYEENMTAFLDALTILYQSIPDMMDAGYAGYGHWQVGGQAPAFDNFTAGYSHGIWMFNKTEEEARDAFGPVLLQIRQHEAVLFINESYATYPDYWTFYYNNSGSYSTVGLMAAAGSRLFDRKSLSDQSAVRTMVEAVAGTSDEAVINTVCLISSGKVFEDAADPFSGILPAWRTSYIQNSLARIIPPSADEEMKKQIHDDITFTKVRAMKALAPDTGAYMNEADFNEPDFENDYYGCNYPRFRFIKAKYDPTSLFYCPTCVGSREWKADETGRLCAVY